MSDEDDGVLYGVIDAYNGYVGGLHRSKYAAIEEAISNRLGDDSDHWDVYEMKKIPDYINSIDDYVICPWCDEEVLRGDASWDEENESYYHEGCYEEMVDERVEDFEDDWDDDPEDDSEPIREITVSDVMAMLDESDSVRAGKVAFRMNDIRKKAT